MGAPITMNGDVIANGTVYANGRVIVQGIDIKAEIERLSGDLRSLDLKHAQRVDDAVYFVIQNFELRPEEGTALRNAMRTADAIADQAGRLQFWVSFVTQINPLLAVSIVTLTKFLARQVASVGTKK